MKQSKGYVINKSKIVRNIVIIILFIILFNTFIFPIIGKDKLVTKSIIINDNDTLWTIASNIANENKNRNLSTRKLIYEIKQINELKDSNIYVGQTLEIPVY